MKDNAEMWICILVGVGLICLTVMTWIEKTHPRQQEAETCLCKCNK